MATKNIHIGLSNWAANTVYSVGQRRKNGSNAYECIQGGSSASSGGPTGTGSNIVDNGARWKYLSAVDYTSIQAWIDALPSTLTSPEVGQLWKNASPLVVGTIGTPIADFTAKTASSTNTITLTCAPGESHRDASSPVLAYDATKGVALQAAASGNSEINWINCCSHVIIDGIQIKNPNASDHSSIIGHYTDTAQAPVIRNCIIDAYAYDPNGSYIIFSDGQNGRLINSLIIDRNTTGYTSVQFSNTGAAVVNNTFVLATYTANTGALDAGNAGNGTQTARNNLFINYDIPFRAPSGTPWTTERNGYTASSFNVANTATAGTGNKFSLSPSTEFVNSTSDFRLKSGAQSINAGVTDSTNVPANDDIFRTARSSWDFGAHEFVSATTHQGSATIQGVGNASATALTTVWGGSTLFPGVGSLSVTAVRRTPGNAVIPGEGFFALNWVNPKKDGAATFPGVGSFVVPGIKVSTLSALSSSNSLASFAKRMFVTTQNTTQAVSSAIRNSGLVKSTTTAPVSSLVPSGARSTTDLLSSTSALASLRRATSIRPLVNVAVAPTAPKSVTPAFLTAAMTPLSSIRRSVGKLANIQNAAVAALATGHKYAVSATQTTAAVASLVKQYGANLIAPVTPQPVVQRSVFTSFRSLTRAIASIVARRVGLGEGTIHLVGRLLRLEAESTTLSIGSAQQPLVLRDDNDTVSANTLLHPVAIDPLDQVYLVISGNALLSKGEEVITSATFTRSSQAQIDGHLLQASSFDADARTMTLKVTGGVAGRQYAWVLTFGSTDVDGRTQFRRRSFVVQVSTL